MFFRVNGRHWSENSLACAIGAGIVVLAWKLSRISYILEFRSPGDFFVLLLTLCYASLQVPRYFVHCDCCIKVP